MTSKHLIYISTLVIVIISSCSTEKNKNNFEPPATVNHIKNFGFTLVDTYWDDPTDTNTKTNYSDEVYTFSNVADIIAITPTDNLMDRINAMANLEMQAIIHLYPIFFEIVGTNSPSGTDFNLRSDYQSRWDELVSNNNLLDLQSNISAFYIGEEPTWNGISFDELNTVSNYVKSQFPDVPIMLIEAYPGLENLQIPSTVDWIGFDHYFIENPSTNLEFLQELELLKSKRSNPNQKLVLVMDTHYIDFAHGDIGNISLNEMKDVAINYFNLAKSEPSVITVLGYYWPNGFDTPESIGARGMPQFIKDEYIKIGKEITGKE